MTPLPTPPMPTGPAGPSDTSPRPVFCPFCERIEHGEYEITFRGDVVRFRPLNPVTPGHMLFLPESHAQHPSPFLLAASMEAAAHYAEPGESYNLITSSGTADTQTVPHLHVHYVPRHAGDGLALPWTAQQPDPDVSNQETADYLIERGWRPPARKLTTAVEVEALPVGAILTDTDPRLIAALTDLGHEFGALGVALAAAYLTDPAVLVYQLTTEPAEETKPMPTTCPKCCGEGRVANSEDQEPWSAWESLPPGSDFAVRMGIVQPMPCPECAVAHDGKPTGHNSECGPTAPEPPPDPLPIRWDGGTEQATQIINLILANDGTARYVGEGEGHMLRHTFEDVAEFIAVDTTDGATHRMDVGEYLMRRDGQLAFTVAGADTTAAVRP